MRNDVTGKVKDAVDIVQIASTTRCNFSCKMCPRAFHAIEYKDMPYSLYRRIVERLPASVKAIDLTGWGEPLLHPRIFEMVRYAQKKGFITYLTSNGSLLNRVNRRKLLDSKLDSITISVENISSLKPKAWAHPFSKSVVENIKRLIETRHDDAKPCITLCVTLHWGCESEVMKIVKFARDYGVDSVNLSRLNSAFQDGLKPYSDKEMLAIWRKCLKLQKNKRPLIVLTHFRYLGLNLKYPTNKFCPKIFNYVYIDTNGNVVPCCNLQDYPMGNILKDELLKIWKNKKFRSFRRNQLPICRGKCNLYSF